MMGPFIMRFPPRLSKLARVARLPSPMQRKHVPVPVPIARGRLVVVEVPVRTTTGRRRLERHPVLDRRWGDAGREGEVTFRREEGRVVCSLGSRETRAGERACE